MVNEPEDHSEDASAEGYSEDASAEVHSEDATEDWDSDSALGTPYTSSLGSATSADFQYTYENGRRYHGVRDDTYFMPNDETEQEGMDLMHHISNMILGGELYRAPVEDPQAVLDIGTGTGIWAIDVADKFPSASVVGTDLSPIQPSWIPPNLTFEVDDCEADWPSSRKFDFIHIRNLSGAISDWPKLLSNCYRFLKPGGYIECSNIEAWGNSANNTLPDDSASYTWQTNIKAAAAAVGREFNISPQFQSLLQQAGFDGVKDDQHKIPMSQWMPGHHNHELAFYFQELVSLELEALSLRLYTKVLGWPPGKVYLLLSKVRREVKNPLYQMYSTM